MSNTEINDKLTMMEDDNSCIASRRVKLMGQSGKT